MAAPNQDSQDSQTDKTGQPRQDSQTNKTGQPNRQDRMVPPPLFPLSFPSQDGRLTPFQDGGFFRKKMFISAFCSAFH